MFFWGNTVPSLNKQTSGNKPWDRFSAVMIFTENCCIFCDLVQFETCQKLCTLHGNILSDLYLKFLCSPSSKK